MRDCSYPSKCRKCGSGCQNKNFNVLHECYNRKSVGAAELTAETKSLSTCNTSGQNLTVHKIRSAENRSIFTIVQIYHFTGHVWGINCSPFLALMAFKCLVEENSTYAGQLILKAVKNNRYMDDILLDLYFFQ